VEERRKEDAEIYIHIYRGKRERGRVQALIVKVEAKGVTSVVTGRV
jgi:hypothetical protein